MVNQFCYLDYEKKNIQGREFIVVYVLEFYKKQIFKIYKLSDTNLISKLNTFEKFDNINDFITFVIKRDAKISLDINL